MVEEIHHPDGAIEHPAVRHERSDASFVWVVAILLGAAGLAVVITCLLWWFFTRYNAYQAAMKESSFPLAPNAATALPEQPRLEQLNRLEGIESSNVYLRELRKESILHSYGPTSEEGFLRIPIERAMTLLENRQPARAERSDGERRANGLVNSGASNSGRLFREKAPWYEP